jgi:hypothetical protein
MKICDKCGSSCQNNTIRCPNCGAFFTDVGVSTSNSQPSGQRRRFVAQYSDDDDDDDYMDNTSDSSSIIRPRAEMEYDSGTSYHITRPRNGFWRILIRLRPFIRVFMPLILIFLAIFLFVSNWSVIKPVLTCICVGAIIGGGLLTFLSIRFGRHFHPGVMTAGAVVGAVLACVFQYNILNIGTELGGLLYALTPVVIMIIGIGYMFSGFRR